MMNRICLLLEALTIVICLHHLYGKKFRLDIVTGSFLAIDMIVMTAINDWGLPNALSILMWPIIAIYCGIKFGYKFKALIVNNILYMVLISGIQLVAMLICYYVLGIQRITNTKMLILNCLILGIVIFVLPKKQMLKMSLYLQDKEKITAIAFGISILAILYCLISFKEINLITQFDLAQYILLFLCVGIIGLLAVKMGKYKIRSKEIETELKMHQLYSDSFHSLIDNIRMRQHEFDNHINTIYSQHFIFDTYEELVDEQKKYCRALEKDSQYNKLLKAGNSVVIGFLYGKFMEMNHAGIEVKYKVEIKELNVGIPVYKLIELTGELLKNAAEALESTSDRRVYMSLTECSGILEIEVRNRCSLLNYEEIEKLFMKGYSKKGEKRGLGLYNLKRICNEYEMKIICQNKDIDGENWISFQITNEKLDQKRCAGDKDSCLPT